MLLGSNRTYVRKKTRVVAQITGSRSRACGKQQPTHRYSAGGERRPFRCAIVWCCARAGGVGARALTGAQAEGSARYSFTTQRISQPHERGRRAFPLRLTGHHLSGHRPWPLAGLAALNTLFVITRATSRWWPTRSLQTRHQNQSHKSFLCTWQCGSLVDTNHFIVFVNVLEVISRKYIKRARHARTTQNINIGL